MFWRSPFVLLSFFLFGHCVVCPSIYGFWLLLWYLQTLLIKQNYLFSFLFLLTTWYLLFKCLLQLTRQKSKLLLVFPCYILFWLSRAIIRITWNIELSWLWHWIHDRVRTINSELQNHAQLDTEIHVKAVRTFLLSFIGSQHHWKTGRCSNSQLQLWRFLQHTSSLVFRKTSNWRSLARAHAW